MLDVTLTSRFEPGTNLKGNVPSADWAYLLPGRELEHVLCIGRFEAAALRTLATTAAHVMVMGPTSDSDQALPASVDARISRLDASPLLDRSPLNLPDASVNLVAVAPDAARWFNHDWFRAEILRLLKPDGCVYLATDGAGQQSGSEHASRLADTYTNAVSFRVVPDRAGHVRAAFPAQHHVAEQYFQKHRLDIAKRAGGWKRVLSRLIPSFARRRPAQHHALLLSPSAELCCDPPQYLRTIAAQCGVDLAGYQWGFTAHGGYSSRKVVFFLFPPGETQLKYVAKLPRSAEHNARLENEHRALSALDEASVDLNGAVPKPAFFGSHGQLTVLGQTAIHGRPFAAATTWAADCAVARSVLETLTRLGASTTSLAISGEVADSMRSLYEKFQAVYRLTGRQQAFLKSQIDQLATGLSLPTVFQHGDPGTWNVLVTTAGNPALLDWEAAETRGVPLWDLFYFLRSYGVGAARAAGAGNNLKACHRHFIAGSQLSGMIRDAVAQYCEAIAVPPILVGPLFYSCWMHRALKEATRLSPATLSRGHYVTLLKMFIDERQSPALRNLDGGRGVRAAALRPAAKTNEISLLPTCPT